MGEGEYAREFELQKKGDRRRRVGKIGEWAGKGWDWI
jgi:hypothetical protein